MFIALLYTAGRWFINGFYEALNIPFAFVDFTVWEYAEVVWRYLLLYLLKGIFYGGIFLLFLTLLKPFFRWVGQRFIQLLNKRKRRMTSTGENKGEVVVENISRALRILLWMAIILFILYSILNWVADMGDEGRRYGRSILMSNSMEIELVSEIPLNLDTQKSDKTSSSTPSTYFYSGYRFLLFNGDRYFIFKELDDVTCRPTQIYVIRSEHLVQVNLRQVEPIAACPTAQQ